MTTSPPSVALGDELKDIGDMNVRRLLEIGEGMELAANAFDVVTQQIGQAQEQVWTFSIPLCNDHNGQLISSSPIEYKREDLQYRYSTMRNFGLPYVGVLQAVTLMEDWMDRVIRSVLCKYPMKLKKTRQVPITVLLSAASLESARDMAVSLFLHELSYRTPREYADEASEILGISLTDIPAFSRYVEVKATRDIWVHNLGQCNDIYIHKAGSHARVKVGDYLPLNVPYFLHCYHTCITLTQDTHSQLQSIWPATPAPSQVVASSAPVSPSHGVPTGLTPLLKPKD